MSTRSKAKNRKAIPRFLSRVLVNWLRAGGTFNRCLRILLCLWILTTLGHFTNLCKSFLGGRAPPIPNCFGRFSNNGFTTFSWYPKNNNSDNQVKLRSMKKKKRKINKNNYKYRLLLCRDRRLSSSLGGLYRSKWWIINKL